MQGIKHRPTDIDSYQGKAPVILCENAGHQWRFYCQYCRVYHRHGAGAGHRAAHCTSTDSPWKESGYILKLREEESNGD